ncbi:sporulation and spore germination [Leptospira ryugenii]|uniref:Sporulation and spore germination n=1 Tax=Leptospira ryugenii TaxID=1917863 RepID=A0A2P2DX51_9LEPT|nr:GerMN domain-containing protein [Leptospira ryugenii]GBF49186.1 sporulation and spore germination [Leptospira ryugenii]
MKSLSYLLAGLFFVLVLIEKSMGFQGTRLPNPTLTQQGFRNLGNTKAPSLQQNQMQNLGGNGDLDWEDDLSWEEEALEGAIPLQTNPTSNKQSVDDFQIPEINFPEEGFAKGKKKIQVNAGFVPIYFLKFYGQGKHSQSNLVKVMREFSGGDPIPFVLEQLQIGPIAEEKQKGILSAIPKRMRYESQYRLEDGILHLSFSKELGIGGSPEILKDRLDQITFSLVGNYGIKGVVLYIDNLRLRSLGGDGMSLPDVLVKNNRKVILL